MRWHHWFRNGLTQPRTDRISRPRPPGRGRLRPRLEQFEDRTLLVSYTAASVSDLINDIDAANKAGGTNTITLAANKNFDLNAVDNIVDGPTALPVITAGDSLAIIGNGDVIQRKNSAPNFRFFDVSSGASLTLESLTLQGGSELGSGSAAEGGALYNQGSLTLRSVTVQNNVAAGISGANAANAFSNGGDGQPAAGGGIWSSGPLTLNNGTLIQNNTAAGGNGGAAFNANYGTGPITSFGGNGGYAKGAGIYLAGGTQNLTAGTLYQNNAVGGSGGSAAGKYGGQKAFNGGKAGGGSGGGLYAEAATLTLSSVIVQGNTASPIASGSGLFIEGFTATLTGNTIQSNSATTGFTNAVVDRTGGAIYILDSKANLTGNTVDSNGGSRYTPGCVVYVFDGGNALSSFSSTSDTVESNTGTGIYVYGASAATVSNDTVESNSGYNFGGGIAITHAQATLSHDTVAFNSAGEFGGGIAIEGSTVTLSDSTVESNTGGTLQFGFGGGIYITTSENYAGAATSVTLSNDTVESNTVGSTEVPPFVHPEYYGAGICIQGAVATLNNDIVKYNTAIGSSGSGEYAGGAYGGGIYIDIGATVTLCDDTVQSNSATNGAGGLYIGTGTVYIDSAAVDGVDPTVVANNTDNSGTNGLTANIDNAFGTLIPQNC
jgi:hypothetical protein